jgi:hypothetical protein
MIIQLHSAVTEFLEKLHRIKSEDYEALQKKIQTLQFAFGQCGHTRLGESFFGFYFEQYWVCYHVRVSDRIVDVTDIQSPSEW